MPSALLRFIVPLLVTALAAYIFRLFGFGWRIYRPAGNSEGRGKGGGLAWQVSMIREGRYLPYIDAMGDEIIRASGDIDEFRRLRAEFATLVRAGDSPFSQDHSAKVNELVARIIDIYRESTGREGLSLSAVRGP